MGSFNVRIYLVLLLLTLFPFNAALSTELGFPVFDALLYKNKPDLSIYGMRPIQMVYPASIWRPGESRDLPNFDMITSRSKSLQPEVVACFDIEHWSLTGTPKDVDDNIANYLGVVSAAKKGQPRLKLGFYGAVPIRDYWRSSKARGMKQYDVWIRYNRKLAPIAERVDVVFPSLYTFYEDKAGWERYAIESLKEARKYGKPVYAFIWPMYHDSTKLKGTFIPADFWKLQLETCKKLADGIVIWGGWNGGVMEWDPKAEWWIETLKFINSN